MDTTDKIAHRLVHVFTSVESNIDDDYGALNLARQSVGVDDDKISAQLKLIKDECTRDGLTEAQAKDIVDNFSKRLAEAQKKLNDYTSTLNAKHQALSTLAQKTQNGLSAADQKTFEAMMKFDPDHLPDDAELKANIDALKAGNPGLYQAWVDVKRNEMKLAKEVIALNSQITGANINISNLGVSQEKAARIQALVDGLSSLTATRNSDVEDEKSVIDELKSDMDAFQKQLLEKAGIKGATAQAEEDAAARHRAEQADLERRAAEVQRQRGTVR